MSPEVIAFIYVVGMGLSLALGLLLVEHLIDLRDRRNKSARRHR